MRICIVTPYDLSLDGGVNRHAASLAAALRGLGHETRVVGPASGDVPEGCDGVPGVVPVPANGSVAHIGLLASPARTRELLERGRYDLVHVHEPIVPGPGRHALRHATVPVVATFHANADRELPLLTVLRRLASASGGLSRIAHAIAVSRAAKRFSRPIYRGRTAVIPNGVDLSRFTAGRPAATPRTGEAGGVPRVLFVGRFEEPRKGFPVLMEAVALLARQGRRLDLHVVGAGDPARFADRALPLGVVFHGRVSDTELAEHYRTADVFCAPSLGGESFGMVLVEAMAAGCPVVASDLPGYAEAARGAALLVPPGDAPGLASAIGRASTEGVLRRRLSVRGLARADALCWNRVAGRVAHIYAVALGGRALPEDQPGVVARAVRTVPG